MLLYAYVLIQEVNKRGWKFLQKYKLKKQFEITRVIGVE